MEVCFLFLPDVRNCYLDCLFVTFCQEFYQINYFKFEIWLYLFLKLPTRENSVSLPVVSSGFLFEIWLKISLLCTFTILALHLYISILRDILHIMNPGQDAGFDHSLFQALRKIFRIKTKLENSLKFAVLRSLNVAKNTIICYYILVSISFLA